MRGSKYAHILNQQSQGSDYGPESLAIELRHVLVHKLNICSFLNGHLAVAKYGPKSSLDPNYQKEVYKPKSIAPDKLEASSYNLAKSDRISAYLKHMASELVVLLGSC